MSSMKLFNSATKISITSSFGQKIKIANSEKEPAVSLRTFWVSPNYEILYIFKYDKAKLINLYQIFKKIMYIIIILTSEIKLGFTKLPR